MYGTGDSYSQCHMTQIHERLAPYVRRRSRAPLSKTPCWIGSFLREARTGSSPNWSVRMRPLIVALTQKKRAL